MSQSQQPIVFETGRAVGQARAMLPISLRCWFTGLIFSLATDKAWPLPVFALNRPSLGFHCNCKRSGLVERG